MPTPSPNDPDELYEDDDLPDLDDSDELDDELERLTKLSPREINGERALRRWEEERETPGGNWR